MQFGFKNRNMIVYETESQSEVCWESEQEETLPVKILELKTTPVRIVKKRSISPGDFTSSPDLDRKKKQCLNESFESFTSEDFDVTDLQLLSAIEKIEKRDEFKSTESLESAKEIFERQKKQSLDESFESFTSEDFDVTEQQLLSAVENIKNGEESELTEFLENDREKLDFSEAKQTK